jgi:hypothetical protein
MGDRSPRRDLNKTGEFLMENIKRILLKLSGEALSGVFP